MPTLYTEAESNAKKTWLYLTGFLVFIIFIGWFISWLVGSYIILWIAVIYSILMSFFSYWYSDKIILNISRVKSIKKKDNPELYRLVENLCITAGLPLPKIYIMPEKQPNAFATGRDKNYSAIVVTQGLLDKLERVELEGVLAHELSHIGNRDILLSSVIVVLVGIIVMITDIFFRLSFFGSFSDENDNGNGQIILLAISLILAIFAPLLAILMKLAISRKREFLADASGALLTRYPEGLARALEKIASDETPMKKYSNSMAHLFIESPARGKQKRSWISKLFLTHPPVEERIKALRSMEI